MSHKPTLYKSASKQSPLERIMAFQLAAALIPAEREWRFDPGRRWRFDFAWPKQFLALEIEGGIWRNGRHSRGKGFEADCEKYNRATLLGWRVLRVTGKQVKSGEALEWVKSGLGL